MRSSVRRHSSSDYDSPLLPKSSTKCSKCCLCCERFLALGIVGIVFGLAFLAIGIVSEFYAKPAFRQKIISEILVDSPKSSSYNMWETNYYDGAPILYNIFTFYNLTNVADVLQGKKPVYTEVGPFAYKLMNSKFDVDFSPDGNTVEYYQYSRYIFDESTSAYPEDTYIVNMNPAYIGIMEQTGGEFEFLAAFTGPSLHMILNFLTGPFVNYTLSYSSPAILSDQKARLVDMTSEPVFYSVWANSTTAPSGWQGMVVSYNVMPSGISMQSAQALWNPQTSYSLLNVTRSATDVWSNAMNGDSASISILQNAFNLTPNQLSMVTSWLQNQFQPQFVYSNVSATWQVSNLTDLGWMQWGSGVITGGVSVNTLYSQMNYNMTPEYGLFWTIEPDKFSVADAKFLFEGPFGLFNAQNVGLFSAAVLAENYTALRVNWGLDAVRAPLFLGYFGYATDKIATPYVHSLFAQGGGLFTNRTVHQWLFNATDPFLLWLQPEKPTCSLLVNLTSEDDTRAKTNKSSFYTGKDDINLIGYYITFNNQSVIPGLYNFNLTINGTNDWGQFPPFLDYYTILGSFNEQYMRLIELVPVGITSHKGVTSLRYQVSNDTFMQNWDYAMGIQGFANMTGQQHAPIFESNPHMMLADRQWWSQIEGIRQPDPLLDLTWVDIEPITGKVIAVNKSIQANVYISSDTFWFNVWNAGVRRGLMYPIMYASEQSELTDAQAKQVTSTLYVFKEVVSLSFPVMVTVGGVLTLFATLSLVVGIRRKLALRHNYIQLNDD